MQNKGICYDNNDPREDGSTAKAFIRIKVPRGTKCFYFGTNEFEMLFKHNIKIVTRKYHTGKFVCKNRTKICHILDNVSIYDMEIVK